MVVEEPVAGEVVPVVVDVVLLEVEPVLLDEVSALLDALGAGVVVVVLVVDDELAGAGAGAGVVTVVVLVSRVRSVHAPRAAVNRAAVSAAPTEADRVWFIVSPYLKVVPSRTDMAAP